MKKGINPVLLITIIILFAIKGAIIFSMISSLIQTGGADSISQLVTDYQTAVNNGDEDLYLSLVPKSERNKLERSYVSDKLDEHSGKSYTMKNGSYISQGDDMIGETIGELFVLDPIGSPFITDMYELEVYVTDADDNTYVATLDVLEINGKYFIHDVSMY